MTRALRFVLALSKLLPSRVIKSPAGDPYMVRFYIVRFRRFAVFLHYICRSDDDRALHDHPWNFTTLLLAGKYTEHLPGGFKRTKTAGDIVRHQAEDLHRLELARPVVTLFIRGTKRRLWGFADPVYGWIRHDHYAAHMEAVTRAARSRTFREHVRQVIQ